MTYTKIKFHKQGLLPMVLLQFGSFTGSLRQEETRNLHDFHHLSFFKSSNLLLFGGYRKSVSSIFWNMRKVHVAKFFEAFDFIVQNQEIRKSPFFFFWSFFF